MKPLPHFKRWLLISIAFSILALPACVQTTYSGLKVGDPAPDFSLPASNGKTVSLSDFKGQQPVLLYFHMANG